MRKYRGILLTEGEAMKRLSIIYCSLMLAFLLGTHNGYVALWEENRSSVIHVFPYRTGDLPIRKQRQLEQGIPITEEYQLVQILKDYLS